MCVPRFVDRAAFLPDSRFALSVLLDHLASLAFALLPEQWHTKNLPLNRGTRQQAQEVIQIYQHRWLIEEWHKCLKTGCRVTSRQLQTRERLEPLIALFSIQAVRLLSLKHLSREQPDAPARDHVPEVHLEVLSRHLRRPPAQWTIGVFVREVAGLGGFLKRKHEGHPGWQTIWDGWQQLIRLVEGYQLAQPPPKCG